MPSLVAPDRNPWQLQQFQANRKKLTAGMMLWHKKGRPRYIAYKWRDKIYRLTAHVGENATWIVIWSENRRYIASSEVRE